MDEKTEKAAFAAFLLEVGNVPNAAFTAACKVHPENFGRALWISHNWAKDAEVLAELAAFKKNRIPFAGQPDNEGAALVVWETLLDCKKRGDADGVAKLNKEYRIMRGWVEAKPGTVVNVNTNRVMVVKDFGTDEEWEAAAARQQHDLTHGKHVVH